MAGMLHETERNIVNINLALERAERGGASLDMFEPSYVDWVKAVHFSHGQLDSYDEEHPLNLYPTATRECLLALGETLHFELKPPIPYVDCAYSRCADPTPNFGVKFACSACCMTKYCSSRCQKL
jgi:hypothetical protein